MVTQKRKPKYTLEKHMTLCVPLITQEGETLEDAIKFCTELYETNFKISD